MRRPLIAGRAQYRLLAFLFYQTNPNFRSLVGEYDMEEQTDFIYPDERQFVQLDNNENIFVKKGDEQLLDVSIFRYTTLFNLEIVLSGNYFFNLKKNFSDKYEGGIFLGFPVKIAGKEYSVEEEEMIFEKWQHLCELNRRTGNWLTTCWTLSGPDSYLMWKSYTQGPLNVCIQTTMRNLLFGLTSSSNVLYFGKMHYRNSIRATDYTKFAFHKLKCYAFENELRIYLFPRVDNIGSNVASIYTPIKDSSSLIEKVMLSPFSKGEIIGAIKQLLVNRYNMDKSKIVVSQIIDC